MKNKRDLMRGTRVYLLPLEKKDIERCRAWVNDRSLWPLLLREGPVTRQDQAQWYQRIVSDPGKSVFAIRTRQEDQYIGNTGFYHIEPIHRKASFWILIGDKKYWGNGYGTETVRHMINYGFRSLHLNKIYLDVAKNNPAAIALYQKSGFSAEGIFKEHCFIQGKYRDVLRMYLLKKDYKAKTLKP